MGGQQLPIGIHLDYRSLYHNYENGYMCSDRDAMADTKADCERMFPRAAR